MSGGFVPILLALALYGGLHSLLAGHTAKRWAERRFGAAYHRFYRLFFNLFAGITLLPVLALLRWLPDRAIYTIPMPWVLLTGVVQIAAAGGMLLAVRQTGTLDFLGLAQLHAAPSAHTMTTGGLYAWVRHPIYLFGLIILWLTPVMTWNVLALNLGASLYMTLGAALLEERKLRAEFGEAYAEYQRRVPMLIPRPRRR